MDLEKLVKDYHDAWNRHDTAELLQLLHKDASIYDGFWMEICAGEDLARYMNEGFDDDNYWYQPTGSLIPVDNGVVYRYSAHEWTDSGIGELVYRGAEVLILRGDKIISVSDYYCDPRQTSLEEVARLAVKSHGRPRRMRYGLGTVKASQFRALLSAMMDHDEVFLDPNLTLSQVADQMGCSVNQLTQLISTEFGASFYSFLDKHRVRYARDLLLKESDDPDYVHDVAATAGFRSFKDFNRSFSKLFKVTPTEFHRDNTK